ncbi:transposase [Actinoplanes sp. CA-142083]|uniref:transposase n=1 Tax=Actinoplanes sp. CA-142083 TaxID=3239903 RepID=UPI003D8E4118
MAKRYRPVDRDQVFLLPPSMMDWLPADHLVWFVIDAVGELDTAAFHARARLGGVGRRGYDPEMLLTLLVYAMAHGVRSSRQIERLCHTDVAFRVICASDVPDHTVLARFRQDHETALADLLTATLLLAARLGMVRLGVVAFDGTKIAGNAARDANRSEQGLRRLAEQYLADTAATDAAEDTEFGGDERGDELPPRLRDRSGRAARIRQALAEAEKAGAAERARRDAAEQAGADYERNLADPDLSVFGPPPKTADPVAAARARWQRERARIQRRADAWHERAARTRAAGNQPHGRPPLPADQHCRVKTAKAAYDAAAVDAGTGAAEDPTTTDTPGPRVNLTDPDSRLLKTRNGWLQGYNCQTAVSEDQFFLHAQATQDANDVQQFEPTRTAITDLAAHLTAHTGRTDLTIGVMIGDAGYDSINNLTCHGPDRLIAGTTSRQLGDHATTNPATGQPPEHATIRQAMNHRLRTTAGRNLYKRRSPLVEAPNSWLKDRRGLRQFLRRGLTATNSELRFAAAVTNLLRIHTLTTE